MKKEQIELSALLTAAIDIEAIASVSAFTWDTDCQLDALARTIKKQITENIGDEIDAIAGKTKTVSAKVRAEALASKDPNIEFQKLISKETSLTEMSEKEESLYKQKIDFEFEPVHITEEQRKDGYADLPEDGADFKGAQVEWKGKSFAVTNLHKRLRGLVLDGWITVGDQVTQPAKIKPLRNRG